MFGKLEKLAIKLQNVVVRCKVVSGAKFFAKSENQPEPPLYSDMSRWKLADAKNLLFLNIVPTVLIAYLLIISYVIGELDKPKSF